MRSQDVNNNGSFLWSYVWFLCINIATKISPMSLLKCVYNVLENKLTPVITYGIAHQIINAAVRFQSPCAECLKSPPFCCRLESIIQQAWIKAAAMFVCTECVKGVWCLIIPASSDRFWALNLWHCCWLRLSCSPSNGCVVVDVLPVFRAHHRPAQGGALS